MKPKKPLPPESLQNFDALMRGLILVSRKDIEEQIAKERKSKTSRSTRRK